MDFAKIRPRGGTKAQWEKANPVLAKREIGVQWETTIGVGEVVIKIGDGVTDWINLPEAVKSDITKKIIATLAVVPDDDPDLADGDSLDTLFGKIAKKFKYLKDNKLDKSARYDGTDSTSTELVPTANALRGVNAKADKNASDITTLNNNLSNQTDRVTQLYSDLSKNIIAKTFNAQVTVKANEGYICDVPFTVPDGYELLDVVDTYILNTPAALSQQGIVEGKIKVYLHPFYNGSGGVYVKVLFKKKS